MKFRIPRMFNVAVTGAAIALAVGVTVRFGLMPVHRTSRSLFSLPIEPSFDAVTIRALDSKTKTFSHPFSRGGLYVGVRMSAIRLEDKPATTDEAPGAPPSQSAARHKPALILYNPTHLNAASRSSLDSWGDVRWIVAPSHVHHTFLDDMAAAYPAATVIAGAGMGQKHPRIAKEGRMVELNAARPSSAPAGLSSDVQIEYLADFIHQEILLFHAPSRTLFCADSIFNLPAIEAYKHADISDAERGAFLQRVADRNARPNKSVHQYFVRLAAGSLSLSGLRPTARLERSMRRVFDEWQPERIVMQHGEVIEADGLQALKQAWSKTMQVNQKHK